MARDARQDEPIARAAIGQRVWTLTLPSPTLRRCAGEDTGRLLASHFTPLKGYDRQFPGHRDDGSFAPDAGSQRGEAFLELAVVALAYSAPGVVPCSSTVSENTTFDTSDFRNILRRFTPEARKANQAFVHLLGKVRLTTAPAPAYQLVS